MTDNPNNGGPAFPITAGNHVYAQGMTLREWFAGQALVGLLAESMHDCGPKGIAHDCYQYADAMLEERNK